MELKLEKIDNYELSSFIKKLLPIDKFIFLKIEKENMVSSVYFPQRDAVKLANVSTKDTFTGKIEKPIKVSFYNGSKVIDALSQFSGEIKGKIKYSEMDGELMASDFIIENDDLKINLACADPSLSFMEMSTEDTNRAFNTDSKLFEFELLISHVEKMKSLFNLDKEEDVFKLVLTDRGIAVKGNTYDAILTHQYDADCDAGTEVIIYKKYLNLLDKENYKITVCENKVVFKSLDTNTYLTVAVAISDED